MAATESEPEHHHLLHDLREACSVTAAPVRNAISVHTQQQFVNANHHPSALAGKRWKTQNNSSKNAARSEEKSSPEQPPRRSSRRRCTCAAKGGRSSKP